MKGFWTLWPIFFIWITTVLITLATGFLFLNYRQVLAQNQKQAKNLALIEQNSHYQMYVSQPKVLSATQMQGKTEDAIPVMVRNYLIKHKSPMVDEADSLVETARKYNLYPFLLVAIAQCESNLGKKMPAECYNPFGWGIHSTGTLCFSSWKEGFEKVAKGLREKYLDKGLIDPQEIMLKYNLNSVQNAEGAWAKCVEKFLREIELQ